jgi:hypothetical protein
VADSFSGLSGLGYYKASRICSLIPVKKNFSHPNGNTKSSPLQAYRHSLDKLLPGELPANGVSRFAQRHILHHVYFFATLFDLD